MAENVNINITRPKFVCPPGAPTRLQILYPPQGKFAGVVFPPTKKKIMSSGQQSERDGMEGESQARPHGYAKKRDKKPLEAVPKKKGKSAKPNIHESVNKGKMPMPLDPLGGKKKTTLNPLGKEDQINPFENRDNKGKGHLTGAKGRSECPSTKGRHTASKGWFIENIYQSSMDNTVWDVKGKTQKGKTQKGKTHKGPNQPGGAINETLPTIIDLCAEEEETQEEKIAPEIEGEQEKRRGWMNTILEEGYKPPDFQNPHRLRKMLYKIQESLDHQKYESNTKWSTQEDEITQEKIDQDFHLQILTEPTYIPKEKEKKKKVPHTADLLNEITGVECEEFELDADSP